MGCLQGMDNVLMENKWRDIPKHIINWRKRTASKCDLDRSIQTISVPHPEIPHLPGDIRIWMGWLFFYIKLVHFEMDQWMQAAGLRHGYGEIVRPTIANWPEPFEEELDHAEEGL